LVERTGQSGKNTDLC